ncbi:MAG: type 4a pilus biogenesis protein PilO [bacterium]|nr:type 4a pilus biogenesis protein PilO [bacterium]MCS7308787.1 type 4a pilus biogenesis protein PilO [Armatimonadota bacterium]
MKRIVRNVEGISALRGLITICAVVLLLGAGGAYWQYTGYAQLQSQVQAAEQQVEEGRTIARRLERTQQQYQQAAQQLQHLEQSVSERAYIPTLLQQLESSARACQLRVLSVRPAPAQTPQKAQQEGEEQKQAENKKPAEPYEKQVIDVSVRGQFWNVMRFTEGLTRFPKILAVERVQLRPSQRKEPDDPFEVEAQFTLTAFIFRNAQGGAPS